MANRNSLEANGVPIEAIHLVPYGVDATVFIQRSFIPRPAERLRVIFVGSVIQRKGISYLLDAVRLLGSKQIALKICSNGFIDTDLLQAYKDLDIEIKLALPTPQLVHELHQSDVFVLPSLAEGFAHVILEAMSCGVPVVSTTHTCAPDVMLDGKHGFIVPIRDPNAIAEKLAWALDHRSELVTMGEAAAVQASLFTWERFRERIREAYKSMVESVDRANRYE